MNIGSSLASLVAATCISMGASAQSQLTLCNENPTENISTAVIYRVNQPFNREWVAYGWVTIAPNKCVVVAQTPSGYLEVFLSTLSQDIHGGKAHIMHFAFNEFSENNSTASERFFCVQDESFKRTLGTIDAHQNCPSGWYKQLFNLFVNAEPDSNFKLRL